MERYARRKGALRDAIDRTVADVEGELNKEAINDDFLQQKLKKLQDLSQKLSEIDNNVLDAMLDDQTTDEQYKAESRVIEQYEDAVRRATHLINKRLDKLAIPYVPPPSQAASSGGAKRNFKLPKIELLKFSGDLREWLSWSSQFKKIHEDEDLHTIDKFSYLIQSMVPGSRAQRLVSCYPVIEENYGKALGALQERFGDTTLLVEIYVRQLSQLVIRNATSKKPTCLSSMFDELDSSLRALESLGVTMAQSAAFLYPLVESSLPEELQKVWQRSSLSGYQDDEEEGKKAVDDRLKALMTFLKQEVKGAERLAFVQEGVVHAERRRSPQRKKSPEEVPTAIGLYSGEKLICIFCEKSHESKDCGAASSMSLQDKRRRIENKRVCYSCFRPGHSAKKCKVFVRCIICDKGHNTMLCPELSKVKEVAKNSQSAAKVKSPEKTIGAAATDGSIVLLQTLKIRLSGPRGQKVVRALYDSGSQHSYILDSTAAELGLQSLEIKELDQTYFGGGSSGVQNHNIHRVIANPLNGGNGVSLTLLGQGQICGRVPAIPRGNLLKKLRKLGIWVTDIGPEAGTIEVLLAADLAGTLLKLNAKRITDSIIAIELVLGWTLIGPTTPDSESSLSMLTTTTCLEVSELKQLWDLETLGISDPIRVKSEAQRDIEAKQLLAQSLNRKEDGRYVVKLPWVDEANVAPYNFNVAIKRLESTTTKLRKSGNYHVYNEIFLAWQKEGLIEIADPNERRCHYLPHRAVFKPESLTTPVRPVFDASCKQGRSPSLNECLLKGPNLIELLPSVLQRFRQRRIGVVADIRKAYQMIEVEEHDRDFLRFLWWTEDGQVLHFRHARVVFGVNCSAFILGAVLHHHLENVPEMEMETACKLKNSLYVDNSVLSLDSIEELEKFKLESTAMLSRAKMELRQWEWNSVEGLGVGSPSGECGLSLGRGLPSRDVSSISNVLGMKWDKQSDMIFCDIPKFVMDVVTKRAVLSSIAKIFDPLGLLSPATITPKIILQRSWKMNKDWDEELEPQDKRKFMEWCKEMHLLSNIQIPRFAFQGATESWSTQLHTFCDSSKDAYAAVVFVRIQRNNGRGANVYFLQGKSRVAPLKNPTVPRLELLGCLVGARLLQSVVDSLNIHSLPRYYWTDSSVALAWIQRNDEWGTFVGNRVKEIITSSCADDWRYIPGESNPADLPSRGCNPAQLFQSRWWEGPKWLSENIETWPTSVVQVDEDLVAAEKKKSTATLVNTVSSTERHRWYLIKSPYNTNIRIFGWILRFFKILKKEDREVGNLTVAEVEDAEKRLFRVVQQESFPRNVSLINGLQVEWSEELYKVKTRLLHRSDSASFKSPVLLPSSHPFVEQLVWSEHITNCHAGSLILLCRLREKVWIIRARRTIKSVLRGCLACKRHSCKLAEVDPAPLPLDRIKNTSAFEVTGVDLAGPLFLKGGGKAWIVIFTCAVYRCVHLELVSSLSTEAFLSALQKFICRRGRPTVIYSDNGTNFRGADNLFRSLQWKDIENFAGVKRITWKFNPPSAAWWGGFWERLIRSTKDLLKRMLGHQKLSFNSLELCLCEVEALLNGRPLTYISEDQEDLVPITPEMFLHPLKFSSFPERAEADGVNLCEKVKKLGKLKEELRSRFRSEYLAQLIHRGKAKKVVSVKVGDIVLVGSDQKKRLLWPVGRIEELIVGADGKCRVAKIKIKDDIVTRPLQRIYPLEISLEELPPLPSSEERPEQESNEGEKEDEPTPIEDNKEKVVVSRRGRRIRKPKRYE